MNNIDLHMHSTFSDGVFTPEELVLRCKEAGIHTVSITDHDTLDHIPAILEAGKKHSVRVISGTELSVIHSGQNFHMTAYHVNPKSSLDQRLGHFHTARKSRIDAIIVKLRECGFVIEHADVKQLASGTIGKPHIAQAILARQENSQLLVKLGIFSIGGIIERYLLRGCPAYVAREKLGAEEAIRLVHESGGLTVFAHPGWTFRKKLAELPNFLEALVALGLDGVETFCAKHDEQSVRLIHETAEQLRLFETAGSDFHGPDRPPYTEVGIWNNYGLNHDFSRVLKG